MEKQAVKKYKKVKDKTSRKIVSKGVYENGEIKLSGEKLPKKRMNVVVTFREAGKDAIRTKEKAVDNFIKKWSGAIKEQDIKLVMEKKVEYLVEKHK